VREGGREGEREGGREGGREGVKRRSCGDAIRGNNDIIKETAKWTK